MVSALGQRLKQGKEIRPLEKQAAPDLEGLDLPGVDPSNVELTLEDGILTLSGERNSAVSKKGPDAELQQQRVERYLGRFYRRFVLPDTADSEKVNASGKDGVLTVTIPKQPKSLPRRIQIG